MDLLLNNPLRTMKRRLYFILGGISLRAVLVGVPAGLGWWNKLRREVRCLHFGL